jgi:hypothetical protein
LLLPWEILNFNYEIVIDLLVRRKLLSLFL